MSFDHIYFAYHDFILKLNHIYFAYHHLILKLNQNCVVRIFVYENYNYADLEVFNVKVICLTITSRQYFYIELIMVIEDNLD